LWGLKIHRLKGTRQKKKEKILETKSSVIYASEIRVAEKITVHLLQDYRRKTHRTYTAKAVQVGGG